MPSGVDLTFETKNYVDSAVFEKKTKKPEVADVTEIRKKEEEYKLLVKVSVLYCKPSSWFGVL